MFGKKVPALTGKSFEAVAQGAAEDGTAMTPEEARIVFLTAQACGMDVTVREDLTEQVAEGVLEAQDHDENAQSLEQKAHSQRDAACRNRDRVGVVQGLQALLDGPKGQNS